MEGEVINGIRQVIGRDVEEGGTGPYAIIFVIRPEVLKSGNFYCLTDETGGLSGDFSYGVEGVDGVTLIDEISAVPAAAAAGIQDGTPGRNEGEEIGIKGGKVQISGTIDKVGGVVCVEIQGFTHLDLF